MHMLDYNYEDKILAGTGCRIICGVDEAGRGPLAGDVVAAACILSIGTALKIDGLNDSKALSPSKRDRLYDIITSSSVSWCTASASVEEIDRINILHAAMLAMNRAISGLTMTEETFNFQKSGSGMIGRGGEPIMPEIALIDGNFKKGIDYNAVTVVSGDAIVPSIAAASILAKVTRDRICAYMHEQYPEYGFDRHKGYSTREHMKNIVKYGITPYHRKTFLKFLENEER